MSLFPFATDAHPDLDPWGTVVDLGSELLAGDGAAFGKITAGTPEAPFHAAYFGVSRSRFRMTYPFNEHAVVVAGTVSLTNEATDETRTFTAGEGWFVEKGTAIVWDVQSDLFVKHYLAVA
ncbi:cupin domain-containing protein [Novosphingobium sp. SG720]|uniref:cupin domain-containing protein n=1 Tax=Novosphingobium sp. SG720 TaxID=2586998 RepID=UPI001447D17E|nr:cupin domain-containing protein [Novosphingobium sp. SG720]NKJ44489.1 hypothetical protein [Novosphingobium sp. SG720]